MTFPFITRKAHEQAMVCQKQSLKDQMCRELDQLHADHRKTLKKATEIVGKMMGVTAEEMREEGRVRFKMDLSPELLRAINLHDPDCLIEMIIAHFACELRNTRFIG